MKRPMLLLLAIALSGPIFAVDLYEEFRVGYANDLSVTLGLQLRELSSTLPVFLGVDGGYIYQFDPGQAEEARAIFINDGTGGNVEEYGQSWHYGLTLGYEFLSSPGFSIAAVGTVRGNAYAASYAFIGDNEAFRVTTNQAGVGAGLATILGDASSRLRYTLNARATYYFPARFDAHGTFYYTPDGVDASPRNDFTYEDADTAVNEPGVRLGVDLGILLRLGD